MEIRENQIEDILVGSPSLMQSIMGLEEEPRLIGRQIIVPSGRLDMLYTYQQDLYLIELKVATFQKRFIKQVLDYKNDLLCFQKQGKLVQGYIQPFLMLPKISNSGKSEIESNGVLIQEYDPEKVLEFFYNEKLRPITFFSEYKPIDIGIWSIPLINKFIYFLKRTNSIKDLLAIVGGSSKTLYNKIKFSNELGLVNWVKNGDYIALTKLGERYVSAKDEFYEESLSDEQINILKEHIMQNPYESAVILGIATVVECVFTLSKTLYPVPISQLEEHFTIYSGKIYDWQTQKAKSNGAKMYSNYAIDLGLMAKNDKNVYLTPEGLKFVVQMQLHKSLKLIDYMSIKQHYIIIIKKISFNYRRVADKHKVWYNKIQGNTGLKELNPQPYWGFDDLASLAGTKLLNCFYVQAEVKKMNGKEYFHYNKVLMLQKFSFDGFLKELENGNVLVDFDARTGHNHGTKFRMRKNCLPNLYTKVTQII